jgi:hypothetical protein
MDPSAASVLARLGGRLQNMGGAAALGKPAQGVDENGRPVAVECRYLFLFFSLRF